MTDARRYDRANDPYYVVRDEIARHVDDLARRARSGAASATASAALERDIESARWELDELDRAIAVAERESARYKLDAREIDERKRWSARARGTVEEAMATTRARARAGRANGGGDGDANGTTARDERETRASARRDSTIINSYSCEGKMRIWTTYRRAYRASDKSV